MSKNLSQGKDRGQGVKKNNSDGSKNPEWEKIHHGTPLPKDATESHSISFNEEDMDDWDDDIDD